jgi:YHS domain-containing protein
MHLTQRIRRAFIAVLVIAFLAGWAGTALAVDPVFSTYLGGAIRGYDPVAYFTEGKPVAGKRTHRLEWKGATWSFSSAKNKELFEAAPEKYAPRYGGYCAFAVSRGSTASIDPDAWSIVDGALYLNYSLGVRAQWSGDIPGNIAKGNANWPKLLAGK